MRIDRSEPRRMRGLGTVRRTSAEARLVLGALVLIVGCGAVRPERAGAQPTLAGIWRLGETRGELPRQAARALEGNTASGASVTIRIQQTEAAVTVRRLDDPAPLLRVMSLATATIEHQVPDGGVLRARAEWRGRAIVATGHVAVRRGVVTRNVRFEEVWHLDESGRTLTVTTTLNTPLGVKHRTQVFARVMEDAWRAEQPASVATRLAAVKQFHRDVNACSRQARQASAIAAARGVRDAISGALPIEAL